MDRENGYFKFVALNREKSMIEAYIYNSASQHRFKNF